MNAGILSPGSAVAGRRGVSQLVTAQMITSTTTWVSPGTGWVALLLFGAGGSGACVQISGGGSPRVTGGAAGGTCFKLFPVVRGQAYTITIGAGGAARVLAAPGSLAGLAGGDTSCVGPGVSMFALGGQGGTLSTVDGTAMTGSLGGGAIGGDYMLQGGSSGDIASITLAAPLCTGGGAPRVWPGNTNGGNITGTPTNSVGSGGGGVGSPGANASALGGSAGGGTGPSQGATVLTYPALLMGLIQLTGAGSAGANDTASTPAITTWGAGSGGLRSAANGSLTSGAVLFGGSGGHGSATQTVCSTGGVTYAGGSGALASVQAGLSGTFTAGKGGDGLALLAFYA